MYWVECLDVLFRNKWADEEKYLKPGGCFQLTLSDGCRSTVMAQEMEKRKWARVRVSIFRSLMGSLY